MIRFKQGFGRLIRTQRDKGVVMVFDRRIVDAKYGKWFIRSLPDIEIRYQPFLNILIEVKAWMDKE
ncbi:helicase C-terminal domain-containing protein [Tepidibacillus marianensis]|uniref:helicase C-terminal domain-containing protein n=1 Tax=Tepidibacillus marianensis TaxID=3131995 RepID=UPI0030CE3DA1